MRALISLIVILISWSTLGQSGEIEPDWFYAVEKEVIPKAAVGPVTIKLHITPDDTCGLTTVEAAPDNMEIVGPLVQSANIAKGEKKTFSWKTSIPDNDTCGLLFTIRAQSYSGSDKYKQKTAIYWITTGDTIESYRVNPRTSSTGKYGKDTIPVPIKNTSRRIRDTTESKGCLKKK